MREAFDVPPPPGKVSLDLGPVRTPRTFALGEALRLARHGQEGVEARAEIVDIRPGGDGVTLTVYADASRAEPWVLAAQPVQIVILR